VRIMVTTRHIEAAVETSASAVLAFVAVPEQNPPHPLADLRFRALVGESDWARLPDAVCRRFAKRLSPEDAVFYRTGWSRQICRARAGSSPSSPARSVRRCR